MDAFFCFGHGKYEEDIRSLPWMELAKLVVRQARSIRETEEPDQRSLEEFVLSATELAVRNLQP